MGTWGWFGLDQLQECEFPELAGIGETLAVLDDEWDARRASEICRIVWETKLREIAPPPRVERGLLFPPRSTRLRPRAE